MSDKIKYKWHVSQGFAGACYEGEWEFDEEPTEEHLNELLQEEIFNYDASYYTRIEGD